LILLGIQDELLILLGIQGSRQRTNWSDSHLSIDKRGNETSRVIACLGTFVVSYSDARKTTRVIGEHCHMVAKRQMYNILSALEN
jgi:hypothetical protein